MASSAIDRPAAGLRLAAALLSFIALYAGRAYADRHRFEYPEVGDPDAVFIETADGEWQNHAHGKTYRFRLARETSLFLDLHDPDRNMTVRLYNNGRVYWTDHRRMDWAEGDDWFALGEAGVGRWVGETFSYTETDGTLGRFYNPADDLWLNKAHGKTYSFRSAGRTEAGLDLYDQSRDFTVRIGQDGDITWRVDGEWHSLGEGEGYWHAWPDDIGDATWTIPVLVVSYFPMAAGDDRLDRGVTSGVAASLEAMRRRCARLTMETKLALEEGSRFRAYRDPRVAPSLAYEISEVLEFREALPRSEKRYDDKWVPDYEAILRKVGVREYVEEKGIKEVWLWAYHASDMQLWESNVASRFGDISNSDRDPDDLPVLESTYTVYHYNYDRETPMAVHDHLHQVEAVNREHIGELWGEFEGAPGRWRCGNCHFPPNGEQDYDYANERYVESDIEDWRPEGEGRSRRINCNDWLSDDLNWYVLWMRSIPGRDNRLSYRDRPLTNWWMFTGDLDSALSNRLGGTE